MFNVINEIQEKLEGVTPEKLSQNEILILAISDLQGSLLSFPQASSGNPVLRPSGYQLDSRVRGNDGRLQKGSLNLGRCLLLLHYKSQIAIRNHKKEKIEALRNALFNCVKPNAPDEDKKMIFLRLIDDLTPWHLRLLGLLNGPERWMRDHSVNNPGWSLGGFSSVIEHCLPDLRGASDFYGQLIRDLQAGGLIHQGSFLNVTMSGGAMLESRTTDMGKEFISFISRPN